MPGAQEANTRSHANEQENLTPLAKDPDHKYVCGETGPQPDGALCQIKLKQSLRPQRISINMTNRAMLCEYARYRAERGE